jgi:hypothetical protein
MVVSEFESLKTQPKYCDVIRQRAMNNIEKLGGKIEFTPQGITVTVPEEHRRT